MNHHWDTWLRNTLIWGIASFLITAVALHYRWVVVFGIAAVSSILFIIHIIFKVAEGQRLNKRECRKRKASSIEYEEDGYYRRHGDVHHNRHDDIDIDHDSDIDLDFDYD